MSLRPKKQRAGRKKKPFRLGTVDRPIEMETNSYNLTGFTTHGRKFRLHYTGNKSEIRRSVSYLKKNGKTVAVRKYPNGWYQVFIEET